MRERERVEEREGERRYVRSILSLNWLNNLHDESSQFGGITDE